MAILGQRKNATIQVKNYISAFAYTATSTVVPYQIDSLIYFFSRSTVYVRLIKCKLCNNITLDSKSQNLNKSFSLLLFVDHSERGS